MASETRLDGRMEKRRSIAIVVHLARVGDLPVDGTEMTYTDNISAHGARVVSKRSWQPGEVVQLTSWKDETPLRGKVVYCHRLADDRYGIGLRLETPRVTWATFRAYNGTHG